MKTDIYQQITDQIIAELENGAIPWVKPWKTAGNHEPHNAATGKFYHGVNTLLLWMQASAKGYTNQGWLTYKQANDLGGHVKKGEHGQGIIFWKFLDNTEKDTVTGEEKTSKIPLARLYTVFNVEQCDNLKLPKRETIVLVDHERNELIDAFIDATRAKIVHGGNKAAYRTAKDEIIMPPVGAFKDIESYYATLLHELTHWTGHKSRCDRNLNNRFGGESYAAEELIAELGSAFLCANLGVRGELRHAGYINSWLRVLKQDKRAIFTAASMATKAVQFLHDNEVQELDEVA